MPVHKCPNGKFRIGSGGCNFDSKAKAEAAYRGYLAKKHKGERENLKYEISSLEEDLKLIGLELSKQKKIVIKHGTNESI